MRRSLKPWLREPLVHFFAAGAVLFAAFALLRGPAPEAGDETTIVVDRRALLSFMQYRANTFEPKTFAAVLDSLPEDELAALIDAYATEEALYREARALGLEASDYVIRQRMIDKIRFLLGDVTSGTEIDEAALAEYFAANRDLYAVAPAVTFAHVFFDAEQRGSDGAATAAREAQRALSAANAGVNDTAGHGDRFPFLKSYVDRTFDFIAGHFGAEFAAALEQLPAAPETWQGPLRSAYGEHVVLVTRRSERRLPELAEVRDIVAGDYLRSRANEALAELTQTVRARYRVVVDDVRATPAP